jgi:hypothetical protein
MPDGAHLREHIKQNLAEEVLRRTGEVRLAALGYSMLPTLWPGDQLTIAARTLEQIEPGDVVAYQRSGRLFIHRAIQVESTSPPTVVARGDAMPAADAPISREELLGIVTSVCGADGRSMPVSRNMCLPRLLGLALAYSGKLRGLALRWHARRVGAINSGIVAESRSSS